MNIPELAHDRCGGDLDLYREVYRYSSMFLNDEEIAAITNTPVNTIKEYRKDLKKTTANLPPDQMTEEALHGYINMSDTMLQDMMQVYLTMREDFDINRNNIQRQDGKKTLHVQPKDLITLMQTLMKTQLERAAVLTKFAAVSDKRAALPTTQATTAGMLMNSNAKELEIDIVDVASIEM